MNEITQKEEKFGFGHLEIKMTVDIIDGKEYDTKVEIGNEVLIWVSGEEKDQFKKELQEIIERYRI